MFNIDNLYPLTIVMDRYSGTYSGGEYTAWNMEPVYVPIEIYEGDVECADFFQNKTNDEKIIFGVGNTPNEAIDDLIVKLNKH